MNNNYIYFTSESVSSGHPDKVADQISDAILDAYLAKDTQAKVAVEVMVKDNNCIIGGEAKSTATVDYKQIAQKVMRDIGYCEPSLGFDADNCKFTILIGEQSIEIAEKVLEKAEKPLGAGDQGLMFGYACNETKHLMPMPITLAHNLLIKHQQLRKSGAIPWLLMDAKSQITVKYDANSLKPIAVDTVVLSTQHREVNAKAEPLSAAELETIVKQQIIEAVIPSNLLNSATKYFINRSGSFTIGGPKGDCGLTGRKIIVDTYGGMARHGGGAFSGKDATKVDRSAAYACRYIAKNLVASGVVDKCEIQVSYAIGFDEPTSININTFGTKQYDHISETDIIDTINKVFDLTPSGIINSLKLDRSIYLDTACYGHFGNDTYSWEQTDKVKQIKQILKLK